MDMANKPCHRWPVATFQRRGVTHDFATKAQFELANAMEIATMVTWVAVLCAVVC